MSSAAPIDVAVIGGGQSALALGFYLRRSGLSFVLLDAAAEPGGSWPHAWRSLRLFSPAQWSSLPGWMMPGGPDYYPTRDEAVAYLAEYERRYALPVERPVRVAAVRREGGHFALDCERTLADGSTRRETRLARSVVSATGSWERPWIPEVEGRERFGGTQLHSARYEAPEPFEGQRVLVVGGGNSGAQVLAELSRVARTTWVTLEPPRFLPDDVDGRVLFDQATARYRALQEGGDYVPPTLGDIVMVPPVREARDRGALDSVRPFARMTGRGVVWADGSEEAVDAVVWCTGFRPALGHLAPLGVVEATGRVRTEGTRATGAPGLWLVGYGNWTGFASATLIGVGRTARATVEELRAALGDGAD